MFEIRVDLSSASPALVVGLVAGVLLLSLLGTLAGLARVLVAVAGRPLLRRAGAWAARRWEREPEEVAA